MKHPFGGFIEEQYPLPLVTGNDGIHRRTDDSVEPEAAEQQFPRRLGFAMDGADRAGFRQFPGRHGSLPTDFRLGLRGTGADQLRPRLFLSHNHPREPPHDQHAKTAIQQGDSRMDIAR